MRGVVTSPVVTPALSHAMPTAVSEAVCKRRGASGVGKRCEASGVKQAAWGKRRGASGVKHAVWRDGHGAGRGFDGHEAGRGFRARLRAQCGRDGGERQQQSEEWQV